MKTFKKCKITKLPLIITLSLWSSLSIADTIDFNSSVNVHKKDICTFTLKKEGGTPVAVYKKTSESHGELSVESDSPMKVIATATGGSGCQLGKLSLLLVHGGEEINHSPALSRGNVNYYFPFDYSLGVTEFTKQGKPVKNIIGSRKILKDGMPIQAIDKFDNAILNNDALYHGHGGNIRWKAFTHAYIDEDSEPFWLTNRTDITEKKITVDALEYESASFTIVPVYSLAPYNKQTSKIDYSGLNDGDELNITTVLHVTPE